MNKKKKICGIVMPISDCDGQDQTHWSDVKSIIEDAANEAGLSARLVSETFESNLIHKEILQNIYEDDIIICDVSGRNPNVFFELGIRMATQKPTVIVKDNKTAYPFDTGPNRYLEYPRSLRHPDMEKFKKELVKALLRTIDQGQDKSFIGHLGPFVVPDVKSTKLPASDIIIDRLESLERRISLSNLEVRRTHNKTENSQRIRFRREAGNKYDVCLKGFSKFQIIEGVKDFQSMLGEEDVEIDIRHVSARHSHVVVSGEVTNSKLFRGDFSTAIEDAVPF